MCKRPYLPTTHISEFLRTMYLGNRPLLRGTECSECGVEIPDDALYYRFLVDGSIVCDACVYKKRERLNREARDG